MLHITVTNEHGGVTAVDKERGVRALPSTRVSLQADGENYPLGHGWFIIDPENGTLSVPVGDSGEKYKRVKLGPGMRIVFDSWPQFMQYDILPDNPS